MVETFFMNLDYDADKAAEEGSAALSFLENTYEKDFIRNRAGIKINDDALTGDIDPAYRDLFKTKGCKIFADKKICHGPDTGERIIKRIYDAVPVDFVTVSATLGTGILKEYVDICRNYGVGVIAFTVHSKISEFDAEKVHRQPVNDAVYSLSQIASDAGCHAVVLEAKMLKEDRFADLPIKKLVTGIRLDESEKGKQARPSLIRDMIELKSSIDYAAISSKYVSDSKKLEKVINLLL